MQNNKLTTQTNDNKRICKYIKFYEKIVNSYFTMKVYKDRGELFFVRFFFNLLSVLKLACFKNFVGNHKVPLVDSKVLWFCFVFFSFLFFYFWFFSGNYTSIVEKQLNSQKS